MEMSRGLGRGRHHISRFQEILPEEARAVYYHPDLSSGPGLPLKRSPESLALIKMSYLAGFSVFFLFKKRLKGKIYSFILKMF